MSIKGLKEFLKPSRRKVFLFLAMPMAYFALLLLFAPYIGSISSTPAGLILGSVFGTILFIGTAPFGLTATISRAMGIDFFYTQGIAAKIGMLAGILLTIIWGYLISCLIISAYNKIKNRK